MPSSLLRLVALALGPAIALTPAKELVAQARAANAPHPQYGSWGVDLAGADTTIRPGADFFRYVNGRWLDRTAIPADRSAYGLRAVMSEVTEGRIKELLAAAGRRASHEPTTIEGKVGAFYRSFLDSAHVERLGATPIAPLLDTVRGA